MLSNEWFHQLLVHSPCAMPLSIKVIFHGLFCLMFLVFWVFLQSWGLWECPSGQLVGWERNNRRVFLTFSLGSFAAFSFLTMSPCNLISSRIFSRLSLIIYPGKFLNVHRALAQVKSGSFTWNWPRENVLFPLSDTHTERHVKYFLTVWRGSRVKLATD